MDNPARERIEIDPDGDVCAIATDSETGNQVCYIVQSKVLSLASPFFRTMFKPGFKTGDTLRNLPAGHSPLEVDAFLDDESSVMHTFFKVLHHQPDPSPLSLDEFTNLAIVVDKYGCYWQFQALSTIWFEELAVASCRNNIFCQDLAEYLGISIAFQNNEMFATVAFGLALTTGEVWNASTVRGRIEGTSLENWVPEQVYGTIEKARETLMLYLFRDAADVIFPSQEHVELCKEMEYDKSKYDHHERLIAKYQTALQKNRLFRQNCNFGAPVDTEEPVFYRYLRLVEVGKEFNGAEELDCFCDKSRCNATEHERELQERLFCVFTQKDTEYLLRHLGPLMPSRQRENERHRWVDHSTHRLGTGGHFHPCLRLIIGQFVKCNSLNKDREPRWRSHRYSVESSQDWLERKEWLDEVEWSSSDEDD